MAGGRTRRPRRAVVVSAAAAAVVSLWAAATTTAAVVAAAAARVAAEVPPTVGWRRSGGAWTPYEFLGRTCGVPSASPLVCSRAATCPCYLSYTVRFDGGRCGGGAGGAVAASNTDALGVTS